MSRVWYFQTKILKIFAIFLQPATDLWFPILAFHVWMFHFCRNLNTFHDYFCIISGYFFAANVHSNRNADSAFSCPNGCGRKYKNKRTIYTHLKYECGVPKQFSCDICGKSFALKHNFKTHMGLVHRLAI